MTAKQNVEAQKSEAIPFPQGDKREHAQLSKAEIQGIDRRIRMLAKRENHTMQTINEITPVIVSDVIAGGNIVVMNRLVSALKGERKKTILGFLRKMTPHVCKNGVFGKKADKVQAAAAVKAFNAFLDSGMTVYGWIDVNMQVEPKPVDYAARLERSIIAALDKGGFTAADAIALLNRVVQEHDQPAEAQAA